jgi:cation transport regulator ChaC
MKKWTLLFWILLSEPSFAFICHPKINAQVPQYLVGYGSLMDEASKRRTDPHARESFPVSIKGYKRSWSLHGDLPGFNTTFLSLSEDQSSLFNGVIYPLNSPEDIQRYDKRESTYCRKQLDADALKLFPTEHIPQQKQVWIYIRAQKVEEYPTEDYPIVQSYVDLFIRGCIQIEEKFKIKHFAKTCIQSTDQWSVYWVNDRIFPRRPSIFEPYASQIDALLKETLPETFKHIRIET